MLCHGPGDVEGETIQLDDELASFLVMAYALNTHGRRLVHRAILSRAKGRSKSEVAGMVASVEALGPCRFDHWAEDGEVSSWGFRFEPGEPVGAAVRSPMLRCLATEEGQAGNTYDNVRVMLERGAVFGRYPGIDVGLTRTFLAGSGEIRPCTAGSASKDGGKESWACADETHLYVLPELVRMHDTVTRNLVKRKKAEPWMLETTTAFLRNGGSVAEASMDYAVKVAGGTIKNRGLLVDHREGELSDDDWDDDDKLIAALAQAYGSAAEWMDLERIVSEIRDPKTRRNDARRYFLNQAVSESAESWLPIGAWAACAGPVAFDPTLPVWVGVDMALKHDSIAVVEAQPQGERIVVRSKIWFPDGSTVDVAAVENHIRELHRQGNVAEVAYDPAYFERSAQALSDEGVPMMEFPQSAARMVPACQTAYELICTRKVLHDGNPVFADQVVSAIPRDTEAGWRLSKGKSKRKIDAAIALVMGLARASTHVPVKRPSKPKVIVLT